MRVLERKKQRGKGESALCLQWWARQRPPGQRLAPPPRPRLVPPAANRGRARPGGPHRATKRRRRVAATARKQKPGAAPKQGNVKSRLVRWRTSAIICAMRVLEWNSKAETESRLFLQWARASGRLVDALLRLLGPGLWPRPQTGAVHLVTGGSTLSPNDFQPPPSAAERTRLKHNIQMTGQNTKKKREKQRGVNTIVMPQWWWTLVAVLAALLAGLIVRRRRRRVAVTARKQKPGAAPKQGNVKSRLVRWRTSAIICAMRVLEWNSKAETESRLFLQWARASGRLVDALLRLLGPGLWPRPQTGDVHFVTEGGVLAHMTQDELAQTHRLTRARYRRVVCLSDTHELHEQLRLPAGDILVVAGDVLRLNRLQCIQVSKEKIRAFGRWLAKQPFEDRIVVAGNHDHAFEALGKEAVRELLGECVTYLVHEPAVVQGLRVFATPKSFGDSGNRAFQTTELSFADVPFGLDLLITHQCLEDDSELLRVWRDKQPRLHVGGHLHYAYGLTRHTPKSTSVTACTVGEAGLLDNLPIVCDLEIEA
ncbi:UPF0046 protein K07C11.7 [Diplonema papillatum]|nr:UPF0046 protein K07C11.7 [Diplonema papillatum]